MKFKLDFSIESTKDRLNFIKKNVDFSILNSKEIELCSNYVLYGKDEDNLSAVDRKEIYIKTKYNSFSRQEPLSLEELLENPNFNEGLLSRPKNYYKKVKSEIDREKCGEIPGMKELWQQIDMLDQKIKKCEEGLEKVEAKELYQMKHQLISLRKEQYLLKDSVFPEIRLRSNSGKFFISEVEYQVNYPVFPSGLMREINDTAFTKPYDSSVQVAVINIEDKIEKLEKEHKPYINFLNAEHIYQLCLNYADIKDQAEKNIDSPLNNLIWTLDFYIGRASLSEQQKLILEYKKLRTPNKEICRLLKEKLGICHKENYISTIWRRICRLIAESADISYTEQLCKDYPKAWKICNCCGKKLFRNSQNFVRKTKSVDGFTNRCKECDKNRKVR